MKTLIGILLAIILASISYVSYAGHDFSKPRYTLLDKNGDPVPGVSQSNDDTRCIQKASEQKTGTYYCEQTRIPITVINNAIIIDDKVILSWTAPTENTDDSQLTDLAGFRVYYGTSSHNLWNFIDIESSLTDELQIKLFAGTYYFAVTAVNELGIESERSDIAIKVLN